MSRTNEGEDKAISGEETYICLLINAGHLCVGCVYPQCYASQLEVDADLLFFLGPATTIWHQYSTGSENFSRRYKCVEVRHPSRVETP